MSRVMVIAIIAHLLGNGDENHTLNRQHLIKFLKAHKESYTMLYGKFMNISMKFMHLSFLVLAV